MQFLKKLFKKKKYQVLHPFAVEAILMLDENTILDKFICVVHAESKRHAKQLIKHRAFIKVGAVANKTQITNAQTKAKNNI